METLKDIPNFNPTTVGHIMLGQENGYASSQNHNVSHAPQYTPDYRPIMPHGTPSTHYGQSMSQPSFTHSQPYSQPCSYSQHHMAPPSHTYDRTPSPSNTYHGYPSMSQGSYVPATPTPRQSLTTLSNNQILQPSANTHTLGDTKVIMKSESSTSGNIFSYSLPEFTPSQTAPQLSTPASSSTHLKAEPTKGNTSQLQNHLPDGQYLSYYEMEEMYSPEQNPQSQTERLARRKWLAALGIDVTPFSLVMVEQIQRDKVEVHWALKSAETRREIEHKAIRLKHINLHIHELPLRLAPLVLRTPVPIKLVGLVPLSFCVLEQTHFNIPQRKLSGYQDLVTKRSAWLKDLGLDDPRYQVVAQSPSDKHTVNSLYNGKSRVERRAIEAKAKYINAMLNPPNPSWERLEKTYEIYPATGFTLHTRYHEKRREWLLQLGLDIPPFCDKTLELHEGNMQGMEVAWSAMTEAERKRILETAKSIKEDNNPILNSWSALEEVYGFTQEKEKEFKNDSAGYNKKRNLWITDIGLHVDPFKNANATATSLQAAWCKKSIAERKTIVNKAKFEKERYVRDKARQKSTLR